MRRYLFTRRVQKVFFTLNDKRHIRGLSCSTFITIIIKVLNPNRDSHITINSVAIVHNRTVVSIPNIKVDESCTIETNKVLILTLLLFWYNEMREGNSSTEQYEYAIKTCECTHIIRNRNTFQELVDELEKLKSIVNS